MRFGREEMAIGVEGGKADSVGRVECVEWDEVVGWEVKCVDVDGW